MKTMRLTCVLLLLGLLAVQAAACVARPAALPILLGTLPIAVGFLVLIAFFPFEDLS